MIEKIEKAYVRHYRDNGQLTAYVEWLDSRGTRGRTEGTATSRDFERVPMAIGRRRFHVGQHMAALFARAKREGVPVTLETW